MLAGHGLCAAAGGKSGLHRTGWWVTPTDRKVRESATESKPPEGGGNEEREMLDEY